MLTSYSSNRSVVIFYCPGYSSILSHCFIHFFGQKPPKDGPSANWDHLLGHYPQYQKWFADQGLRFEMRSYRSENRDRANAFPARQRPLSFRIPV